MGLLGVTGCPDEAWESENLFQGLSCPLWVSPWAAWSRVGVLQITSPQLMGFGVRLGKKLTRLSDTHNTRNAVQSARLLRRQRFAMSPPRLPVGQCQTAYLYDLQFDDNRQPCSLVALVA